MSKNARIELAGSPGNRESSATTGRQLINVYKENSPRGTRVVKRPGLLQNIAPGDCTGQGIVFFAGEVIVVSCDSLNISSTCAQYVINIGTEIEHIGLCFTATDFSATSIPPALAVGTGVFTCLTRYAVGAPKINVANPGAVYGTMGQYMVQFVDTMIPYDTGGFPQWNSVHNTQGTIPFMNSLSPPSFMGTYPMATLGNNAWNLYVSSTWTVTRPGTNSWAASGPASLSASSSGALQAAMVEATRLLYSPDTIGGGGNPIIWTTTFWVDGDNICHVLPGDYYLDTQLNVTLLISEGIVLSSCFV
jgi:hypothetical protein